MGRDDAVAGRSYKRVRGGRINDPATDEAWRQYRSPSLRMSEVAGIGVLDLGMFATDDPATWEILLFP